MSDVTEYEGKDGKKRRVGDAEARLDFNENGVEALIIELPFKTDRIEIDLSVLKENIDNKERPFKFIL